MRILIFFTFLITFSFSNNLFENDKKFYETYSKLEWQNIELSKSEKEWLERNHLIRVRVGNWPPYMYWEKDKPKGIAVDYLKIIADKMNLNIEFLKKVYPFAKAVESLKKHENIDLILMITNNEERRKHIAFTKNYIIQPWVIITKENEDFVGGLDDLKGKSLASVNGYFYNDLIRKEYPEISLNLFDTDEDALKSVSSSKSNAFIGVVAVSTYMINKYNLTNLKIAAPASLIDDTNAMGVRNDWTELTSIIDKSLDSMSPEIHSLVKSNSLSFRYEFGVSWKEILFWVLGIVLIAVIVILVQRNNNKRLRQLINSSIEGIFIFKDRKLIDANEPLKKIFGYSEKEAVGKDILEFIDKKYHKLMLDNLKTTKSPYEIEMIKKDGTVFPALVRGTNIGNGKRISAVIDLTELKKVQDELKELNENLELEIRNQVQENREKDRLLFQQSKLAAMGEMINNIAHQWRQPLNEINSIVMTLDLELMKRDEKNDVYEQMLHNIEIQTEYMSETINNFSRYFTPEKNSTDFYLSETVEDALSILNQGFKSKNIEVELDIRKDKVLEGFPSELIQVIIILLNNASDALFETKIENPKITVIVDEEISIKDNAGGIKPEIINRIFEPYFTTKHKAKGTGIGLYMAKMIIEDSMNGSIEVRNTQNGAIFTIKL